MEVILRIRTGPHAGEEYLCGPRESVVVGRSSQAPLSMPDDRLLSREHFRVTVDAPRCALADLGSTNGTKVNGLRVETATLHDGDVIVAGESEFIVHIEETTFGGAPRARCLGCGHLAAERPPDPRAWLCPDCLAKRRSFPETHPDYLIERKLGNGGMGEVYLARQLSNHRPVAIKMMVPTASAPPKARDYFRREMRVLKDLLMPDGKCHPNIVAFYDIHEIAGQFQLIMEYVAGKHALQWLSDFSSLSSVLPAYPSRPGRSKGPEAHPHPHPHPPNPLPVAAAARIGKQLLAALDYAHSKGYVHRDVKPSNVLVMGPPHRPQIKLSDFGLAKSFRENAGFVGLTRQGDIGGSVGFISPDHIRDFREVKEPADIYCAGVTIYYLLTLRYPYLAFDPNHSDAYTVILENPPIPLRVFRPDAPEGLERVLRKALEKQPQNRWKSAAAMADALRPFIDAATP